jgi:hypothetical protein
MSMGMRLLMLMSTITVVMIGRALFVTVIVAVVVAVVVVVVVVALVLVESENLSILFLNGCLEFGNKCLDCHYNMYSKKGAEMVCECECCVSEDGIDYGLLARVL